MSIILNGTTGITTPTETATTSVTAPLLTSPASTALTIQSAGTTAMTIDTSQNVGIGTTSPGAKLHAYNNSAVVTELRAGNSVSYASILVDSTGASQLYAPGGTQIFSVGGTERIRIDSSGNLLVGGTSGSAVGKDSNIASIYTTAKNGLLVRQTGSSASSYAVVFENSNGTIGTIVTSGSATTYNTSSDYRLKNNVAPIFNGLASINVLKPVTYDWKIDGSFGEGFIAHELQEIIPLAVSGEKDAVNEDGSIKPQGVDYSKIVVHLVAAIQELSAKNDALEAANTAFEARLAALEAK
jgi:hypothetical protein